MFIILRKLLSIVISTLTPFYMNLSPETLPAQTLRASLEPTRGVLVDLSKGRPFGRCLPRALGHKASSHVLQGVSLCIDHLLWVPTSNLPPLDYH